MATVTDRKAAALSAGSNDGAFEVTAHGRRRVGRIPKPIVFVWALIAWPVRMILRSLHRKAT